MGKILFFVIYHFSTWVITSPSGGRSHCGSIAVRHCQHRLTLDTAGSGCQVYTGGCGCGKVYIIWSAQLLMCNLNIQ